MTGPFAELRLRSGQVLLRAYRIADASWYVAARDEVIFQWTTERRTLTVAETEAAILRVNDAADAVCLLIEDWIWFECKATDVELPKQDLSG